MIWSDVCGMLEGWSLRHVMWNGKSTRVKQCDVERINNNEVDAHVQKKRGGCLCSDNYHNGNGTAISGEMHRR